MTVESGMAIRHEVAVDLPPGEAFWVFADLDRIEPRQHNLLAAPIAQTVLDQHVGGDVYDRGIDGRVRRWGSVQDGWPHYLGRYAAPTRGIRGVS